MAKSSFRLNGSNLRPDNARMHAPRPVNIIEATYNHLKLAKVAVLADYRMRRCLPASIPCPECRYGGTIHYPMQDGR
jgi:hypothetical protein